LCLIKAVSVTINIGKGKKMEIKHLESGNTINLNYREWCDNYLKKGIYRKFEVIDYNGVVEF
jgi:hypothetical protein